MFVERLTLALEDGVTIPDAGRIAVVDAPADALAQFSKDRTTFISRQRTLYDAYQAAGVDCAPAPTGAYAAAFLCVPRAKDEAKDMIARLAASTGGEIVVDGQKTQGIDSLIKALRSHGDVSRVISKAHGKLAALQGLTLDDWRAEPTFVDGFVTRAGVFSADGIDPGSKLLAEALPHLKGRVADLGAGWGYLAASVLKSPDVTEIDLVDADAVAIECARENVTDPRAAFLWADAVTWQADVAYDAVVMNPPFHRGRAADPGLGLSFLQTAARVLKRRGVLWMVANRHLPYEARLAALFRSVEEVAGNASFKIIRAEAPKTPGSR
ncbi:MAG: class I SAM-dependent methyltransferase [Rhodobacteraceae bacterium]|nr:class I SAM-dependent methyltransferase [Paracoccaceae bacterium]